jgi:ABC-type nitrate/sulfonate/bicarbonate transport system permease component
VSRGQGSIARLPELPAWAQGTLGGLLLLVLWQAVIAAGFSGNGTIPSRTEIVRQFFVDGPWFYVGNALHTLRAAVQGWLWGNFLAVALATLVMAVPFLAKPVLQLGIVSFCLPIVAIGPVLAIVFSADTPQIALAAMAVFFTTLVGTIMGLNSVDPILLDVVHAFGGKTLDKIFKLRIRAALPSLFAALRVTAPSAVLGAIVGEFLGAENGLGVILVNSQQALDYSRTWAITIFATLVAGLAFAAIGIVARLLTPWARDILPNIAAGTTVAASPRGGTVPMRILRAILGMVASFAFVLAVWWLALRALDVSPFIGKGPLDVWQYLADPENGAANRSGIWADTVITLRDGSIGLVAGTCAAVLTAIAFDLWPAIRRTFMGPALALQTVPLIAVTPLIVLIFGRDLLAVAVIGGIIAFFPTLVNVSLALGRTPTSSIDLARVFGSSRLAALWRIELPIALPALFASLRIAAPLAMTGALLAEWLATGHGLGYGILSAVDVSDYDGLWTRVALVTAFSISLYKLVGLVEQITLNRLFGR